MADKTINLHDFRVANNWTDKKAFEEAMKDPAGTLEIYFPAGGGQGPSGSYNIWTTTWIIPGQVATEGNITRGNVTLYGDGYNSVVRQPGGGEPGDKDPVFMAHPPQNDLSAMKPNILIRDLLLEGCQGRSSGYNQEAHIVRVAGVSGITFQRVLFRNFMGDGLMCGSPVRYANPYPQVQSLLVTSCRFEATSTAARGRNGISLLTGDGYTITGCSFENIGHNPPQPPPPEPPIEPGPGAIDIEPVNSAAIVRTGRINNCSFLNINRSAVALLNGSGATTNDVKVKYCNVQNAGFGLFVIQHHIQVEVSNNYSENLSLQGGFMGYMYDSEHAYIQNNTFINGRYFRISNMLRWTINTNGFRDCAKGDGVIVFQNGNSHYGSMLSNSFYTCGEPGSAQNCIYYVQADGSAEVKFLNINNNTIHNPN